MSDPDLTSVRNRRPDAWRNELLVVAIMTTLATLTSCSSDDKGGAAGIGPDTADAEGAGEGGPPEDAGPSPCEELVAKCQPIDPGDGDIHACVATGMAAVEATCQTTFAGCREVCGKALCRRIGGVCHDKVETCHEMGHAGIAGPCFDTGLDCLKACM